MDSCNHSKCSCVPTAVSTCQTFDEMDFDRGPWSAALDGDLNRLNSLLKKDSFKPDSLDSAGYSSLHYAARAGHLDIVKYLISIGANLNLPTRSGHCTPLHRAAYQGHSAVVKFLLENGSDSTVRDSDGCTALHRCAERGHEDICRLLISQNPDLKRVRDGRNRFPKDHCSDLTLKELLDS